MSTEFDVRLGEKCIQLDVFTEALDKRFRDMCFSGSVPILKYPTLFEGIIGPTPIIFSISADVRAEIQCQSYMAGSEASLGYEGGWWMCFSIIQRTPESFLLLLLVSACFAELLESNIIDDSEILGAEREVFYGQVVMELKKLTGYTFIEASKTICQRFGVKFKHSI
jgi:hypothetical protein